MVVIPMLTKKKRKENIHGDVHIEIIFEGQVMISCKKNIPNGIRERLH
jgi:hypothetical protein